MTTLTPELYVSDLEASLAFYAAVGFAIVYRRDEEGFARIAREGAELMLEEPRGRTWLLGPLGHPRGIGVNLQMTVSNADALFAALPASTTIVLALETKHYRRAHDTITVRQFVVADPDGYLLRFSQLLRSDPLSPAPLPATP